jgi:hypothetical protein
VEGNGKFEIGSNRMPLLVVSSGSVCNREERVCSHISRFLLEVALGECDILNDIISKGTNVEGNQELDFFFWITVGSQS